MNDAINASFEMVAGLLCWLNVRRLNIDKEVKGISWWVQGFFALWGWWNLYYYPTLGQSLSFYGAIFLCAGNTVWTLTAIKYRNR